MKIDQIDTPFLYYESQSRSDDATEHHSIHSNFLKSLAPEVLAGEGAQGATVFRSEADGHGGSAEDPRPFGGR